MENLIQALKTIKREAGSHTVSVSALRPAHGFGFIYDIADAALKEYASQPGVECAKAGNQDICKTCRYSECNCPFHAPGYEDPLST